MKVYLSGVVSLGGRLSEAEVAVNIERFRLAASALRARGHEVIDPTALTPPGPAPSWQDWMRIDLHALLDCDGIVMLPGWEESPGARLEHHVALGLRMPVDDYDRLGATA